MSPFRRRSFLSYLQSAIEYFVDEARVLQQFDNLRPSNLIEKVLTNWSTVANRTFEVTPSVSTETPVVRLRDGVQVPDGYVGSRSRLARRAVRARWISAILHPAPLLRSSSPQGVAEADGQVKAIEIGGYFDCTDGRVDSWWFETLSRERARAGGPLFCTPRLHRTLSGWSKSSAGHRW
jgi:hypothetical protein